MNKNETHKKNKWLVLINVVIGTFMATLDGSIVNVALPSISAGLYIDITTVQWVVTSYLITVSSLLLVFGKLSDIYGRRLLYISGFVIFSLGSLLCGISRNIWFLVGSRVLQAMGAAILMSISQAIISDTFPKEERGKALGITGTVVALGNLTGPSVGGILTGIFGWKSIFLINIPIGIAGAIMSFRVLSDGSKNKTEQFDYKGALMFSVCVIFIFSGALKMSFITMLASLPFVILFIMIEKKQASPILDASLFKIKLFRMGLASAFLSFVASNAITIIMPFYLQSVRGLTPASAGLVLMSFPLAMGISAPISGCMSDVIGYKVLTTAGLLIASCAYLGLYFINATTGFFMLYLLLILMGIGLGIFQSPNNSSIMSSVPNKYLGVAASVNALARNLGMVTGITMAMAIYSFQMTSQGLSENLELIENVQGFILSMKSIYIAAFVVAVLGVVITMLRLKEASQG